MASDSQSSQVEQQVGGVQGVFPARWQGIWINDTERLRRCKFKLLWEKAGKSYEKELEVRDNDISGDWLYQEHKLTIEITHFSRTSKFYIHTVPGSWKDSKYDYEDLSITYSSDDISPTPYEYFYLCPWTLQNDGRWLKIYGTHLDLRLSKKSSDRGIDIDWKFPFSKWLGGYGVGVGEGEGEGKGVGVGVGKGELIPGTVENSRNAFTATLSIVGEYGWPEGFTVWLKVGYSDDEVRISGRKVVDVALSDKPKLVIKKNGEHVAIIYTQDEGSWDLGVCWNVNQTRAGTVKHVYRPPNVDEGCKHDLFVSPKWITMCNYDHSIFGIGSSRGIVADISKELEHWMGENKSVVEKGSSAELDVEEIKDVTVSEKYTSPKGPEPGEEDSG